MSTIATQIRRTILSTLCVVVLLGVSSQGVAHAAANTLLSNRASASGFPVGGQIYDSATLGNGQSPTGLLTFTLFGVDDPTCTTPLFTTTTPVNGNGYYESAYYTTSVAGTYRWTAVYGGDANNNPSAPTLCSDPAGQVSVGKRSPVLNGSNSWAAPSAVESATLAMGGGPAGPTGTMTYSLFGPGNMTCAGAPTFVSTRTVAGNGSYLSAPFSPTVSGVYQWVVSYSGDANNFAATTYCSDATSRFTGSAAVPTVVSGAPTTVSRGGTITVTWSAIATPTSTDWIGVYAVGAANGGAVAAWKYTTGSASGSVSVNFPWGAAPGNYEIRLMAKNSIQRLATSSPITLAG